MRTVWTAVALIGLACAAVLGFVYSGLYNAAATSAHSEPVRWLLSTAMRRSVERRAAEVTPPPPDALRDAERVRAGFAAYDDMCVVCHGAPGSEAGVIARGLNPEAPDLAEQAGAWSEAALYWIVKHGIRMTGMPAFGPTHADAELWDLVAFVRRLPELSAQEYQQLRDERASRSGQAQPGQASPPHEHGHSHEHAH